MIRRHRLFLAAAGVPLMVGTLVGTASTLPPAAAHDSSSAVGKENHAHDEFQPAYVRGTTATYRPGPVPSGADTTAARTLYEVEYPRGWEQELARPQCNYCDHVGDGRGDYDYHDHVLTSLPSKAENRRGEVYWIVSHVQPRYTGHARWDAEISAAYADLLPAESTGDVRRLLRATLPDGTKIARELQTGTVFAGPLTRYPGR